MSDFNTMDRQPADPPQNYFPVELETIETFKMAIKVNEYRRLVAWFTVNDDEPDPYVLSDGMGFQFRAYGDSAIELVTVDIVRQDQSFRASIRCDDRYDDDVVIEHGYVFDASYY